jgi:hypothetical protein
MSGVSTRTRVIRYGAPIATIIVGILFAAVQTNRLGNTVQTVATAGGLIWFMVVVGRDIGMGVSSPERRRVPVSPSPEDDPASSARTNGAVRGHRAGDQPPVSPSK